MTVKVNINVLTLNVISWAAQMTTNNFSLMWLKVVAQLPISPDSQLGIEKYPPHACASQQPCNNLCFAYVVANEQEY